MRLYYLCGEFPCDSRVHNENNDSLFHSAIVSKRENYLHPQLVEKRRVDEASPCNDQTLHKVSEVNSGTFLVCGWTWEGPFSSRISKSFWKSVNSATKVSALFPAHWLMFLLLTSRKISWLISFASFCSNTSLNLMKFNSSFMSAKKLIFDFCLFFIIMQI